MQFFGKTSKKDLENKHELLQQINDKLKGQLKTLQNEFENCENEKNVFANTTEQLQAENDKMKKSHTDNQFKMESMSTAIGKLEEKIKYLKDENNLRSDTQNTHDVDMLHVDVDILANMDSVAVDAMLCDIIRVYGKRNVW